MKLEFDPRRRELLLQICHKRVTFDRGSDEVLVSVRDFFLGNADLGSIGCNLMPHPGMETFASVLETIRERPDVQDVLIGITDLNDAVTDSWPFSDRVYVISTAPIAEVKKWVQALRPDEVSEVGSGEIGPSHMPTPEPGHTLYRAWWD